MEENNVNNQNEMMKETDKHICFENHCWKNRLHKKSHHGCTHGGTCLAQRPAWSR